MKPFVLANAIEQGMNPFTTYYNSHSPIVIPMGYGAAPWVVNGDGPGGMESVAAPTKISDNVVSPSSRGRRPEETGEIAERMGISQPTLAVPVDHLGTSPVTPLEMADAYATLAAGGSTTTAGDRQMVKPSGRTTEAQDKGGAPNLRRGV